MSTPTVATGTPGGIWTIERSASRPSSTLSRERSGTPITGRSVCAATTPGSAAASPAPQISTRSPRSRAVRAYSATESGVAVRRANLELASDPALVELVRGRSMRSRSDSIRRGSRERALTRRHAQPLRDVATVRTPGNEIARPHGRRERARFRGLAQRCDVEDPAPVRHEAPSCKAVPAWKTSAPSASAASIPVDPPAAFALVRVRPGGEDDGHRGFVRHRQGSARGVARRRRPQQREEVALKRGEERLRLRIAEAAVELEHARAVGGQHQAGVEHADERRPATGELVEDGPVDGRPTTSLRVGRAAMGEYAPIPPVFGPESPSPTRLKSRAIGSGTACGRCTKRARRLTPLQQLLEHQARPVAAAWRSAASSSSWSGRRRRPLPVASPAALMRRTGRPRHGQRLGRRDAGGGHEVLREAFRALELRRRLARSEDREAARGGGRSATPDTSGASGPMTTRSTGEGSAHSASKPSPSSARTG